MKSAYVIGFVVLIFLGSCSLHDSSSTDAEKYPLQLGLALEKDMYYSGEPILLKLNLTNVENEDILVKNRFAINFFGAPTQEWDVVLIFGTRGYAEPGWALRRHLAPLKDDDFTILHPNSFVEEEFDLREYYLLEEGEYTVWALYQSSEDPPDGRNAWRGVLRSNSEGFTIKP